MNLTQNQYVQAIKKIGFFIPFSWYFAMYCTAGILGYYWLQSKADLPDSAFGAVFELLVQFALFFCFTAFLLGFLSVIFSVCFFLLMKRRNRISFSIRTEQQHETASSKQKINFHLSPIIKPLLGFIKIRLIFDKNCFSEKFSIVKNTQFKLFSNSIDGVFYWILPEIKEYKVDKAIIYFEDFFQFFSFAIILSTKNTFYTEPLNKNVLNISAFPRKTEDSSIRIDELRKMEGEYINYKNFENNDDVRRIVWKIYAKNKELVVRVPEILDPYASHIFLYASFYSSFNIFGNNAVEVAFLNFFKTYIWSVYKQLQLKGFEVRYISDRIIPQNTLTNSDDLTKYSISVSTWHIQTKLTDYINPKDTSVVIISSLSNAEEVQNLLERYENEISFVFVSLTECLDKQDMVDWLKWLFVKQEEDDIAMYKASWNISLLRLKVIKNERKLINILSKYSNNNLRN